MWSTPNYHFWAKYKEKQPKTSQNGLFSAVFWSKWQDSNLRSHRPERCAIPPSLHLDVVKIFDFFVSGQTCGQTEDLMIFRHSGEPKKSVFSRVFGSSRKIYAERGDWVPNVALYQAEPHLDIQFFRVLATSTSSFGHKHSRLWHSRVLYSLFIPLSHSLHLPRAALVLQA